MLELTSQHGKWENLPTKLNTGHYWIILLKRTQPTSHIRWIPPCSCQYINQPTNQTKSRFGTSCRQGKLCVGWCPSPTTRSLSWLQKMASSGSISSSLFQPSYKGLCLLLLHQIMSCSANITGRHPLFWRKMEKQWMLENGKQDRTGRRGGKVKSGCMGE